MVPITQVLSGSEKKCILFLGAHSDDIEIGCGGTILQLADQIPNCDIHWVVFSARDSRETEASCSASNMLSPFESSSISVCQFRDGYFPSHYDEIKNAFEGLKKHVQPDLVFTHYYRDLHQDHRLISEMTWNTFRDHVVLEYEIPKFDGDIGSPNVFLPLSNDDVERKCEHLREYFVSQRSRHWFAEEVFLGLMRLRGMECRSPSGYAEGFYCRKIVLGF